MTNLLITGGSGYVGTRLIFKLLSKKVNIHNYDISLFGDEHLPSKENFYYHKKDLRDISAFKNVIIKNKIDVVLHLACISNDPTFELNGKISKEINYDAFEPLVKISKENGVKKFIYASTCSVYGVSEKSDVTEEHPLLPITDYNKFKGLCEPVLKKYLDKNFNGIIIRPATVCGFSEKMRFDLSVNILTNFAYNKGYIRVFGGDQLRPNCHIDDMCDLYEKIIFEDISHLNGEIFNLGSENLKIIEIANMISGLVKERYGKQIEIRIEKSTDPRSYHINSDKIKKLLNFNFKRTVKDAVNDLLTNFEAKILQDTFSDQWSNINTLKNNKDFLKSFNL